MWSTMERKANPQRGAFIGRQQHAIRPKILESHAVAIKLLEHPAEALPGEQLTWQDVMTLKSGIISRLPTVIHCAKRYSRLSDR